LGHDVAGWIVADDQRPAEYAVDVLQPGSAV
jgi:hypothetical protein